MALHIQSLLPDSGSGSVGGVAALLVLVGVAATAWRVVYSLCFHPLKDFPGPWYTACTSLPLGIAGLSRSEPAWLCWLVETYGKDGSPVRITPELLLFHKACQLRDIYWDAACNTKGSIYQHEAIGPQSLFTTTSADDHRKLRKAVGGSFWSVGTLKKTWEAKIDDLIVDWVGNRKRPSENRKTIILSNKTSEFAADVMTMVLFTKPWGFVKNDRDERGMLHAWRVGTSLFGLAVRWRFMREVILSSKLKDYILPKMSDEWGNGWLMAQGAREISDRHTKLQGKEKGESVPSFNDVLQTAIDARIDDEPLNDTQKLAHMTLLIQAGADTTGTGLGATLRLILSHPEVLAKVREEITAADAKGHLSNPVVQYDETKRHLPYLSACIRESLRLHPPIPNLFSRLVPPSGDGKTIDGFPIPPGTQMLSHAVVVQRDADAFGPEPTDEFRPERWLESEERSARMEGYMYTFGMGPRVCLGKELALMEMHKLVPEVLRRFGVEVLEEGRYCACGGIAYLQPGLMVRLTARE
ncbi:cytochrome P450 [Apiospora aurea]|uniref:Cytochrome P450 n=1 Tax=Apiospora aurea TaxID=335848 RepID=A0ABR1Q6D0_9PEZI